MRTEEQILKDFEKLDWYIKENTKEWLELSYNAFYIVIDKFKHRYTTHYGFGRYIRMKEHILLHELFELWGWL